MPPESGGVREENFHHGGFKGSFSLLDSSFAEDRYSLMRTDLLEVSDGNQERRGQRKVDRPPDCLALNPLLL